MAIMKELRNVIKFDGLFVRLDDKGHGSQWQKDVWVGNKGVCMAIMKELHGHHKQRIALLHAKHPLE